MSLGVVVGRRAVRELLRSKTPIEEILIVESSREGLKPILEEARKQGIPLRPISPQRLEELSEGIPHQGVGARARLPDPADLGDILDELPRRRDPLLLLLDGVEDPRNLGAAVRVADACGCDAVVLPGRRSAPLTPAVVKASAGAALWVPLVRVSTLTEALGRLKRRGIWSVALDERGPKEHWEANLAGPLAVVVGSEGRGLSHPVLQNVDEVVRIPMKGGVSSLNLSVAVAVVLYERLRQVKAPFRKEGSPSPEGPSP